MSLFLTTSLSANQRLEFNVTGDFFRLMAATQTLTVEFYRNGAEIAEAAGVSVGYAERFRDKKFDRIAIVNGATAQTVQIVARDGADVLYDTPPNGQVTVTNVNGAFTQTSHNVSNAGVTLKAANPQRRYLMIQNKDPSITVEVNVAGGFGALIQVVPGGRLEFADFVPTGSIYAVSGASIVNNVIVLEG
jgi:hypothetical protein